MAGNLKINSVQLGDSATATQNFVLQTNVDGTAKLARGNLGATTQDILTVDAAGKVSLPANTTDKLVRAPGSAPVYGCRAWCAFNGTLTGTNPPTAGGNVASVTRQSAGYYTINFSIPMPSNNYAISISALDSGGGTARIAPAVVPSLAGFSIDFTDVAQTVRQDADAMYISVFC